MFSNILFSMNLFRYQQLETYHLPAEVPTARRQGAAVCSAYSTMRSRPDI
jgi:hypothetical protein